MSIRRRSLEELQTLIYGYYIGLGAHGLVEDAPAMTSHFGDWLQLTRGWGWSTGWAAAIADRAGQSDPLDLFFELRREYRQLCPTTLASITLTDRHQPTGARVVIGMDGRMERPDAAELRRYVPTALHHFRWRYGDVRRDDWMLYRPDGSHETFLDFALDWAAAELQIQPAEWVRSGGAA
jgi:hypothetical protein